MNSLEREIERLKKVEAKIPQVLRDSFRYYWKNSSCRGLYGCPNCDAIKAVCDEYDVDYDEILAELEKEEVEKK